MSDNSRRAFLSQLAAVSAAAAAAACAQPMAATQTASAPPAPEPEAKPHPAPPPMKFDDTWVSKLTAKHKAVFDSPEVAGGIALYNAYLYKAGYKAVYQGADADAQVVLVFRHHGVPLAFNDELWRKYPLGKRVDMKDASGQFVTRNPFWSKDPNDKDTPDDATLQHMVGQGAVILACNLATTNMANQIASQLKLDRNAVLEELRASLIPGAALVPSGIFGFLRAQEAGCVAMKSS